MKSRQRGKKKGSSKERVFGCDLQEHLQHSGQEGKEANSELGEGADTGWVPSFSSLIWFNGQKYLLGLSGEGQWPRATTQETYEQAGQEMWLTEKGEKLPYITVWGCQGTREER